MAQGKKVLSPAELKEIENQKEQIAVLAGMNCSMDEISAVVKIPVRSLQRKFGAVIDQGRLNGKASLKRKMWQCAMGYREKKIVLVKVKSEVKKPDGSVVKTETQEPREVDNIVPANTGMQQWLSKQMLGYSEKVDAQNYQHQTAPIKHEWVISSPDGKEVKLEDFYDDKPQPPKSE